MRWLPVSAPGKLSGSMPPRIPSAASIKATCVLLISPPSLRGTGPFPPEADQPQAEPSLPRVCSSIVLINNRLQLQRARSKEIVHLWPRGQHTLFDRIIEESFHHLHVFLEAIRKWVRTKDLSRFRQVLRPENKSQRNALRQMVVRPNLGLLEGVIQIERDPRMLTVKRAAKHVDIIGRNVTVLPIVSFSLDNNVRKQRLDFAPVALRAANVRRTINDIGLSLESLLHNRHIQLMIDQH